jgi:hypothetical protein
MKGCILEIVSVCIEKSDGKWFVSADYGVFSKDRTVLVSDTVSEGVERCMSNAIESIKRYEGLLDSI